MSSPDHRRIVIIGGVACGPKAAARAQRRDPSAVITLIERDPYLSYAGCGLPYFVAGAVKKIEGLMETPYGALRDRRFFEESKGIRILQPWEATRIDRERKQVSLRASDTGGADHKLRRPGDRDRVRARDPGDLGHGPRQCVHAARSWTSHRDR